MYKYHYCVNTVRNKESIQLSGDIEAKDANDAIQKLIDEGIIDSHYEFLELKKCISKDN